MTKFELGDGNGRWTDITGYAKDIKIDHGAPDSETWGDKLAGLQESSMTLAFDNAGSGFLVPESLFASDAPPKVRISVEVPDGRWQTFKWEAKNRFPRLLRRLKVRYTTHSFDAVLDQWDGGPDVTGRVEGTIAKSLEEHR